MPGGQRLKRGVSRFTAGYTRMTHIPLVFLRPLILFCAVASAACTTGGSADLETINMAGIVGKWAADYTSKRESRHYDISETITLFADGRFIQEYRGGEISYAYRGPCADWHIDPNGVVHLSDGYWFAAGVSEARDYHEGGTLAVTLNGNDYLVEFSKETLLTVGTHLGTIQLAHLPLGDPDSPTIVTFQRISDDASAFQECKSH